jgi:hypothetical protein
MRRPACHSVSDEFDRRNLFLCATLGVIAELGRLRRAARGRTAPGRALILRTAYGGAGGDEALHAVLGLLSLSSTLSAHVRTAAVTRHERGTDAAAPNTLATLRGLFV